MHCTGGARSEGVPGPGVGVCSRGWGCLLQGEPGPVEGGVVSQHALRQTPCEQNSRRTLLKILPCPKLGLWAVKIERKIQFCLVSSNN